MARPAPHDSRPDDAPAAPLGPMSFDAYLAFLERSESRFEYMNGMAYAMAGATHVHDMGTLNVAYLPDAMVGCATRPENDARYLDDPCLIVEVLSRSTARTDLGEKRVAYQEIDTLRGYLAVETTWRALHRHWRDARGEWQRETVTDATGGVVPLPCLRGAALTLGEIYEDVELPAEPPRATRVFEEAVGA